MDERLLLAEAGGGARRAIREAIWVEVEAIHGARSWILCDQDGIPLEGEEFDDTDYADE